MLLIILSGQPDYSIGVQGLGQNGYGIGSPAGFNLEAGFIAEVVLTFIFIFVIFVSTSELVPKNFAGIVIGITLAFVHIVGIPITGTSVNPARSLGPAVFVGGVAADQLWLFWLAPLTGAILAAIVWMVFKYWYDFEQQK